MIKYRGATAVKKDNRIEHDMDGMVGGQRRWKEEGRRGGRAKLRRESDIARVVVFLFLMRARGCAVSFLH